MGCQHTSAHNYNTVDLFGKMLHFSVICIICRRWNVLACLSESDNNSLTYCCPVPLSLRSLFQTLLRSFKDNLNPVFELDLTLKLVDYPCTINKNFFKLQTFIHFKLSLKLKILKWTCLWSQSLACPIKSYLPNSSWVFSKCGHNRSILVIFLELNGWVTEQEHWTLIMARPRHNGFQPQSLTLIPVNEENTKYKHIFWFIMMWRLIKLKLICVGNVNASLWFWYQINVMVEGSYQTFRHWDTTNRTLDLQTHFTECFKICQFYLRVLCSDLQLSESSYWCQNIFRN